MTDARKGLKLFELMAVIAVVGLVLGVTLPLVQAQREEARRATCANNLKQIGLAVHHYITVWDTLPPSGSRDDDPGGLQRFPSASVTGPRQNAWSMQARLLPYLEQQAAANACNFQLDPTWNATETGFEPANQTARSFRVASFLCPSDSTRAASSVAGMAWTNYASNVGNNRRFNGWIPDGPAYFPGWDGPIRQPVTLASVIDGTSNSAIFSEFVRGEGLPLTTSRDGLGMVYAGAIPMDSNLGQINAEYLNAQYCASAVTMLVFSRKGEGWVMQGPGHGFYSHTQSPNRRACGYGSGGINNDTFETMIGASSLHPGGVNVLFLDGSMRWIKNRINYRFWHSFGSIAGSEISAHDPF